MAEYDAFGRKVGDDPVEQAGATAEPAPAPASAPATPSAPQSRTFPVMVAVAAVVVMASIGIAFSMLVAGTEEGVIEPVAVEDAPPAPPPGEAPQGETAVEPGSLLDRPLLARAVKAMRVAELGRPVSLRVSAERIDAQLVTSKGLLRTVQVGVAGVPRELNATQGGRMPSMPWSAVDPAAPQRMVKTATEREKRSAADVDYLVLLDLGKPTWGLFFKGGTHYQGNAAGRKLRRVSP